MYEVNEAYLHSQLEEVQVMNRERTRQTDQYLAGLWSQYRMLLLITIPTLMFSGCGLAYHQFTLNRLGNLGHQLGDIEHQLQDQKYQNLQRNIDELKQQDDTDYKETCNTFFGVQRCTREVQ